MLVARMRQCSGVAVAFVLDGGAWARGGAWTRPRQLDERLRLLRDAGWAALPVTPGTPLPELWRQADQYRARHDGVTAPGAADGGWA